MTPKVKMTIKGEPADLNELYFVPKFFSKHWKTTCGNPKGYVKIYEVDVEFVLFFGDFNIFVRNEKTTWFNTKHCFIGTLEECEDFIKEKEFNDMKDMLYFQVIV